MRKYKNITVIREDGNEAQEFEDLVAALVEQTDFTEQQIRDYLARLDDDEAAPVTVRQWFEENPTVQAIINNDYKTIARYIIEQATLAELRRAIAFSTLVSKYMYQRFVDPPDEPEINGPEVLPEISPEEARAMVGVDWPEKE